MLTFLQFLNESRAAEMVHHNISVPHLKALVKNFGHVRYVIDNKGKLHAGHADNFIHREIDKNDSGKGSIDGYIEYKNGIYNHRTKPRRSSSDVYDPYRSDKRTHKHPLIDKMEKSGIVKSKKSLSFEIPDDLIDLD